MRRRAKHTGGADLRERLAQEAARLMAEHGISDFAVAKRKAAERLGVAASGFLPSNRQIEERLTERQRIFDGEAHSDRLRWLRIAALELMDTLADFEARLVGPVLAGTATINATVEVHAFSDTPEAVAARLQARYGPVRTVERRLRVNRGEHRLLPAFRLTDDGVALLIQVFPEKGLRQAPLSPVDLRPMKRAKRSEVLALLD